METLQFTLRIMRKRPLRSLLTILQMGLGVWIVAVILSLNFQATDSLDAINQAFGDSLARITVSKAEEYPGGMIMSSTDNLRLGDVDKLLESEYINSAFIYQERWQTNILVNGVAYSVSQSAETTADYAQAMNLEIVEGHFFTNRDQRQQSRVVLISEIIAGQLFPNQSPLGQTIDLTHAGEGRLEFEIIGVYKPQSPLLEFFVSPANLIFPLGSTQPNVDKTYHSIVIESNPGQVYQAVADAQLLLADRSRGEMEILGEYFMDSNYYLREQISTITLFLGAFAFIAILISAIGILSIMLVSVVERTREIGLRQALGASKGVIIRQVLNESLVFSVLGAALGLVVAAFTAKHLLALLFAEMVYPRLSNLGGLHPQAAFTSFGLALAIGQLFGFYPALQAARMTPVEALRDG